MTKKPIPIPDFNVKVVLPSGDMHPDWHRFFKELRSAINATIDVIDTPPPPDPEVTLYDQYPYTVGIPTEMDYVIIQNNDVEREIYETLTDCDSGTCTVTFKINSTALGGSAHSASSTEEVISRTTSNILGVGDDLIATVSSNSATKMLRLNAKTSRTIVVS